MRTERRNIELIQITDSHLQTDSNSSTHLYQQLQRTITQAQRQYPKARTLVLTGDLSQDGSRASYEHLANVLKHWRQGEVYAVPGNHDNRAYLQQILPNISPRLPCRIQLGSWQLLLLDSTVAGSNAGKLSNHTFNWLQRTLQQHPTPAVVALHHPPILINSAWMDRMCLLNQHHLRQHLQRHRHVKLVLFGHVHQALEKIVHGIQYCATPSTAYQFKPLTTNFCLDQQQPGYRWLRLTQTGLHATRIKRLVK